ncbi:dynein regulatory complex protein 9 isoform X2 [Coturnix japonica]|nr:dynein regulatory complex protein 9 isoform X2 [Coturnix japonica]
MEKLPRLEALLLTAVLENCIDQLAILGYIMPVSQEGKADVSSINSQEMKEITDTQNVQDIKYQELPPAKQGSGETVTSKSLKSTEQKQQLGNSADPKRAQHPSKRATKPNAPSAEYLRKIQADRQYVSDVITATMKKMEESGTFDSLIEANGREKAKKSNLNDILIREEEGKKEIKSLQKQLQDVKKETEIELQNRNNVILYLKNELQKAEAKAAMEHRYMKKSTDLQVHQTQKKCSNEENRLNKEIEDLKRKTDEEIRVHVEAENFLRHSHKKVQEKLEYWMEKYENDTDAKDKELDDLKESKAKNLEMLQKFASECWTFEETIIADRARREAERRKREQDELELKSILKLQAWWKGTMVRRNLGPYQNLPKAQDNEQVDQKGTKEKPGAKKKTR